MEQKKRISKRTLALIIGLALLLMAAVAAFAAPGISGSFVPGNPAVTALNVTANFSKYTGSVIGWLVIGLLDLLVSWGIYTYYKTEKPKLAVTTGALRFLYSVFLGAAVFHLLQVSRASPAMAIYHSLNVFNSVWGRGLIVFGLHLIALGILFKPEGGKKWLNITIKALLMVAGLGYIILYLGILLAPNPLAFKALIEPVFLIPMILGEVLFAIRMLVKGGKGKEIKKDD